MANGNFVDFIPAGGDNSAYKNGFSDFQPTQEPEVAVVDAAPVVEEVVVKFADLKKEYESLSGKKLKIGTKKEDLVKIIADLKANPVVSSAEEIVAVVPVEPVVEAEEVKPADVPTAETVPSEVVETPVEEVPSVPTPEV